MATSIIKGLIKSEYTITSTDITLSGTWKVKRIGANCYIEVVSISSAPAGAFNITTLPAEYRPARQQNWTIVRRAASTTPLAIVLETDGTLRGYNYGTAISSVVPFSNTLAYTTK